MIYILRYLQKKGNDWINITYPFDNMVDVKDTFDKYVDDYISSPNTSDNHTIEYINFIAKKDNDLVCRIDVQAVSDMNETSGRMVDNTEAYDKYQTGRVMSKKEKKINTGKYVWPGEGR